MRQIKAVIVGYGNRGQVYAAYALQEPKQLKIVGVVDPNKFLLGEAKKAFKLSNQQLFTNLAAFKRAHIKADVVINATMDELHYKTAIEILNMKYNMLMEKPIVNNREQLLKIEALAKKNKCLVLVCHVLRYTPFYRTIKQTLLDNKIGEIVTIEANEHVCLQHYLTAYLRGKWNSEKKCGSGLLLAKSCHDLDIICWLNNNTTPVEVSSFGGRHYFIKKNKPKGAADRCYKCKYQHTCPLSSVTLYVDHNTMAHLTLARLNKRFDEITPKDRLEFIKKDIYGVCAYDIASDLVDRQASIIKFKNGSTASFTLLGLAAKPDRYIHIIGTKGEIEGKIEENKVIIRTYTNDVWKYETEVIDLSKQIINKVKYGGHSGGDYNIMHDLCAYLNKDHSSISITKLSDSINGHLCVYALEKARKSNTIQEVK